MSLTIQYNTKEGESGVIYQRHFYQLLPAWNVFCVAKAPRIASPGTMLTTQPETKHYHFYSELEMINQLEELLSGSDGYVIIFTDGKLTNIADFKKSGRSLPNLLAQLTYLERSVPYYAIIDGTTKTIVMEKVLKDNTIDTYHFQHGRIDNAPYINKLKYYFVCSTGLFKWMREYIDSLKNKLNFDYLILEDPIYYSYQSEPNAVYLFCQSIPKPLLDQKFRKMIINTEQLTIPSNYREMISYKDRKIPIIEYAWENWVMLNKLSIYLPYQYDEEEITRLRLYYQKYPKTHQIAFCGHLTYRRKEILDKLISRNISILLINNSHWDDTRDRQIASCWMLLNIHQSSQHQIYESMRCDRWAFAGMPVISENSIKSDSLDVAQHHLVHFCPYDKLVDEVVQMIKNIRYPMPGDINLVKEIRSNILNNSLSLIHGEQMN